MKTHELKIWPEYFNPVRDGLKTFEVRKDDRGFQVGDNLHLREWQRDGGTEGGGYYTGRALNRRVHYLAKDAPGIEPGCVVMSIESWVPNGGRP